MGACTSMRSGRCRCGATARRSAVGAGGKAAKKPLELLALLCAHPEGMESAEIVDLLCRRWMPIFQASLEMTIARLRQWLAEPDAVRVADGRVALHPGLVWTDVAAF